MKKSIPNLLLKYVHQNFSVYKIARGYPLIYEDFGYWSQDEGISDLRITRVLSKRRRNLRGHQLIGATVFMNKESDNHTDLDDYRLVLVEFYFC